MSITSNYPRHLESASSLGFSPISFGEYNYIHHFCGLLKAVVQSLLGRPLRLSISFRGNVCCKPSSTVYFIRHFSEGGLMIPDGWDDVGRFVVLVQSTPLTKELSVSETRMSYFYD